MEAKKAFEVYFFNGRRRVGNPYLLHLGLEAKAEDLLLELATRLRWPAATDCEAREVAARLAAGQRLRLLAILKHKIMKVVEGTAALSTLEDGYQLRAEFVPEDQEGSELGAGDYLIQLAHCLPPPVLPATADPEPESAHVDGGGARTLTAVQRCGSEAVLRALVDNLPGAAFGEPRLILVREHETMGNLRSRLQALLAAPHGFHSWHLVFVGTRPANAYPDDADDLATYLRGHNIKFAPPAATRAAAGGRSLVCLLDPSKLSLIAVHEDPGDDEQRHTTRLSCDFLALLEEPGDTSDLTLRAGDRSFPVHRAILAARSGYFKALFSSGLPDSTAREHELHDTDPEVLAVLLRYIYGGELACPRGALKRAAQLADRLLLPEAVELLHDRVVSLCSAHTVVGDILWADAQGAEALVRRLERLYAECAAEVADEDNARLATNPQLMARLLKSLAVWSRNVRPRV